MGPRTERLKNEGNIFNLIENLSVALSGYTFMMIQEYYEGCLMNHIKTIVFCCRWQVVC